MTTAAPHAAPPPLASAEEILDESLILVTMPVIGLTIFPGFLLCVPGLLLVVAPVVALGVVALALALVAAVVAGPLLVARAVALHVGHGLAARLRHREAGAYSSAPAAMNVATRVRSPMH